MNEQRLSYARLPLSYTECRSRFRLAASNAGVDVHSHPIAAAGPEGECLSIDVANLGEPGASHLLVLLSGVHGVEGFIGSALQCDLLARSAAMDLPSHVAVLLIHAVNPWGMAWSRRQNESNVDLNRNWRRADIEPRQNDEYDEIHHLACPDGPSMPEVEQLVEAAGVLVAERGIDWVRDAITSGQYRHADGLHYGGTTTEESNRILEAIVATHVAGRHRVLVIDLHTGHGPRGEVTLLSDQPPESDQDRFFRRFFPGVRVEATVDNPSATTGLKSGQIANGIRAGFPDGACWSTSAELGTASDTEQLIATYQAHWVAHHGDAEDRHHAAATWAYRCCFTPDDPVWEHQAFANGQRLIDLAVSAASIWDRPIDEQG